MRPLGLCLALAMFGCDDKGASNRAGADAGQAVDGAADTEVRPGDAAPERDARPDTRFPDATPDQGGAEDAEAPADAGVDAAPPRHDAAVDAAPPPPDAAPTPDAAPPDPCLAAVVAVGDVEVFAHEASRPDATNQSEGEDATRACSVAGVLPWTDLTVDDARAACEASGFALCSGETWTRICDGGPPEPRDFPYGYAHRGGACNDHVSGAEALRPTGDYAECVTPEGIHDLSGNVWEMVEEGERRGGSWRLQAGNFHVRDAGCHQSYVVPGPYHAPDLGFRCCRPAR